jgi:Protein of unknown function (DUF1501)
MPLGRKLLPEQIEAVPPGVNVRDYNPFAFRVWLADSGVKRGFIYAKNDEFGYNVAEKLLELQQAHGTRCVDLDAQEHFPLIHPEKNEPIHQKHGRAL